MVRLSRDLSCGNYGFRNYDAQIGRFTQLDPLTWDYPYYTPYQYAGNEPIANVDLDGLEPLPSIIRPGTWFNLPQLLEPVVITAKSAAPGLRVGMSSVSMASTAISVGNLAMQSMSLGC